ncbi:hypothetical protein [Colwellia psychrerythraea]|uniref:Uncharacterized protein n=1 Tax=Colwellia psychrerythraea (strain 34H / ATCC BAA-681) TaxID=167879 RepID=Q48A42_COLP3|nr:hypothetical protein [Colwellia psychrerythraea]AAZ28298.1 hypothetical protein CPS_0305 [Colwellia psychrerythraea 34H]
MNEQGVIFNSNGKQLVGIEHLPEPIHQGQTNKGVIIVVGGPQTRVGSHRLFVHLARALAKQRIVVFCFDYSGAGDSEGTVSTFTDIQDDIEAAFTPLSSAIVILLSWLDGAYAMLHRPFCFTSMSALNKRR